MEASPRGAGSAMQLQLSPAVPGASPELGELRERVEELERLVSARRSLQWADSADSAPAEAPAGGVGRPQRGRSKI